MLKPILILRPFLQLLGQERSGGLSARCHSENSLWAPQGTFASCLWAQSEPRGFTSAVAACYSAYGVENNIRQKYPRSFLPSSCCCSAVLIPPDCRLLTLSGYPGSGTLHPTLCSHKVHSALQSLLEMTLLLPRQVRCPAMQGSSLKHPKSANRLHRDALSSLQNQARHEEQPLLCFLICTSPVFLKIQEITVYWTI